MTDRYELKYIVSRQQMEIIRVRLSNVMQLDPHAKGDGCYHIKSVYFDDYKNSCYYDNENGNNNRKKYRLRIYNGDTENIHLESKAKLNGKTLKQGCPVSRTAAEQLLSGKLINDYSSCAGLLKTMAADMLSHSLKPVVIVEYDRIPYIYREQNVRVTFDTNIVSNKRIDDFFGLSVTRRPVLPCNYELMEVKFDNYLPELIRELISIPGLCQTAFSKYYLSRKFSS